MKHDERELLIALYHNEKARDAILRLGIPYKRGLYILEKFCRWGYYEYGVTIDLGWITDKGRGLVDDNFNEDGADEAYPYEEERENFMRDAFYTNVGYYS